MRACSRGSLPGSAGAVSHSVCRSMHMMVVPIPAGLGAVHHRRMLRAAARPMGTALVTHAVALVVAISEACLLDGACRCITP
jgi:hypothetical protein